LHPAPNGSPSIDTSRHFSAPQALRTPRAAAIAGVPFALMYGAAVVLVRMAFPGGIADRAGWDASRLPLAGVAIHLLAYGGIAFLWFMGVVRTRLGRHEDRFLATVFVGSGLLFMAMSFVAGAVTSALLGTLATPGAAPLGNGAFALGSRIAFELSNVYGARMAGVFMISLATLCLRTGAMPRAFVWVTYAIAAVLLLSISYTLWAALAFPLWVLGFSLYLLRHGLSGETQMPG
jgi:hypothetical protein